MHRAFEVKTQPFLDTSHSASLREIQEKDQKRQIELDLLHLERRRGQAAGELESEPAAIEALYDVRMSRVTPVGLVIAWPEPMT